MLEKYFYFFIKIRIHTPKLDCVKLLLGDVKLSDPGFM